MDFERQKQEKDKGGVEPIEKSRESEISPEDVNRAKKAAAEFLGVKDEKELENLDKILEGKIKELPRYQEIVKKLANVPDDSVVEELFKLIKREADPEDLETFNPEALSDNKFLKLLLHEKLACAGRTAIASTFLQERGIKHSVAQGPGHAFAIIEKDSDTLAYFDANNNLYFTAPKSAFEGYSGADQTSDCRITDYTPRDSDVSDGMNPAFNHFVLIPPAEGIARQYYLNVGGALNGNKEFESMNVEKDEKAAEAVTEVGRAMLGENAIFERYFDDMDENIKEREARKAVFDATIKDVANTAKNKDDFIEMFTVAINKSDIGEQLVYLKNAPEEKRRQYAEKIYELLHNSKIEEIKKME